MKFKKSKLSPVVAEQKPVVTEGLIDTKAHIDAAKRYRELASITEDVQLTEETLDKEYLSRAACEYGIPRRELRDTLCKECRQLKEEAETPEEKAAVKSAPVQQAMKTLRVGEKDIAFVDFESLDDMDEDDVEDVNDLYQLLDDCLEDAQFIRGRKKSTARVQVVNPLIIGQAGTGKTSVVMKWAKSRNVNLVPFDLSTASVEDFGGMPMPDPDHPGLVRHAITSTTWELLSKPNTVLFLDELNRATGRLRSAVMKLVNEHMLTGPSGQMEYLPNFLFTIGAINPPTSYSGTFEMDNAEIGRYYPYYMTVNKVKLLKSLDSEYAELFDEAVEQGNARQAQLYIGRRALARAILQNRQFQFTSQEEEDNMRDDTRFRPTTPRNFEIALNRSRGTKESLLQVWNNCCDYRQKKAIQDILEDFQDIDDKAIKALSGGTSSSVLKGKFEKDALISDKVMNKLRELGYNV